MEVGMGSFDIVSCTLEHMKMGVMTAPIDRNSDLSRGKPYDLDANLWSQKSGEPQSSLQVLKL
jgi:hypothetical protein